MGICKAQCIEKDCNSFECFYDKECVQYELRDDCKTCKCFKQCSFCKNNDRELK